MQQKLSLRGHEVTPSLLKLFLFFSVLSIIFGVSSSDGDTLRGLNSIIFSPAQSAIDYFAVGGVSAAFLNVGLVGLSSTAIFAFSRADLNAGSVVAFFLTVGFSFMGINILNMWPCVLGTAVFSLIRREHFSLHANTSLFSTAMAPFVSEALLRYPGVEVHEIQLFSVIIALLVGIVSGFLMPAVCEHAPNVHLGTSLYNAGVGAGVIGFLLYTLGYKTMGIDPPTTSILGDGGGAIGPIFCIVFFVACFLAGFLLNNHSLRDIITVLRCTGYKTNLPRDYGMPLTLMSTGIYGLFIMLYYFVIGAAFTAPTMGAVFCMLAPVALGSNPLNVLPIMVGYFLASLFGYWDLNTQAIVIGLCFANGLSPLAGRYGFVCGIIAGMFHSFVVVSVPLLHGGLCLYNGGFACAFVALLLTPIFETFFRTSGVIRLPGILPLIKKKDEREVIILPKKHNEEEKRKAQEDLFEIQDADIPETADIDLD